MYAEVVIPQIPVSPFTYRIPKEYINWISVGSRVRVPVRSRNLVGFVIEIKEKTELKRLKEIISFLEPFPLISENLISLLKWVSDYYICRLPDCFTAAFPSRLLTLSELMIQIPDEKGKMKQIPSSDLPDRFIFKSDIEKLLGDISSGNIKTKYKRLRKVQPKETIDTPIINGHYNQILTPNLSQQRAIDEIISKLERGGNTNYLLYGVTGSGKTLVYMETAEWVIRRGFSVLMLVPEISITPVMEKRFEESFGDKVIVLHSRLTPAERFKRWDMVRKGSVSVVIGPRSTVFVPMENLGLIVVDEEQDPSYKQEGDPPYYNARDVAVMRGHLESIPVILGSATPSLESFHNAKNEKYRLLKLPERPEGVEMPEVVILDMKQERMIGASLSATLISRMNDVLLEGKQVLLLLNRRGYARYVRCPLCGYIWRCPNCDINLTFHKQTGKLICHYCGKKEPPPDSCPRCGNESISMFGTGTQRLEKILNDIFPEVNVARMDLDSTAPKGNLQRIIDDVNEGRVGILMGTQMVGKGFDFPNIKLTGIISTDLGLSFPDFRARENTFRLLTQAAGRAGRRSEKGEVIIQTFTPDEYSISHACNQDYEGFYEEEITSRRKLLYPPFVKLILFTVSSPDQEASAKAAKTLKYKLETIRKLYTGKIFRLLGPAPAPLFKLRKRYRNQLLLKLDSVIRFNEIIRKKYPLSTSAIPPDNVRLSINVDPQDML